MNEEQKLLLSTIIFFIIASIVLLTYHRIKYYKSNYYTFEDYLIGESKICKLLNFLDFIFSCMLVFGLLFGFGYLTKLLIF
jgi:hypothetical protein